MTQMGEFSGAGARLPESPRFIHESQIPLWLIRQCAISSSYDHLYEWLRRERLCLKQPLHEIPEATQQAARELLHGHQALFNELLIRTGSGIDRPHINRVSQGIVAGRIVATRLHPNADRLRLANVDVGNENILQIVYGGVGELHEGDIVPVALPGAELEGGGKIRVRNWRGQRSEGMLCSATEWGLPEIYSPAADRVFILPEEFTPGDSLDNVSTRSDGRLWYLVDVQ
jgi:tRNA-binding EMAP/Myf-like protein